MCQWVLEFYSSREDFSVLYFYEIAYLTIFMDFGCDSVQLGRVNLRVWVTAHNASPSFKTLVHSMSNVR